MPAWIRRMIRCALSEQTYSDVDRHSAKQTSSRVIGPRTVDAQYGPDSSAKRMAQESRLVDGVDVPRHILIP
jgi:hypothetical protein